MDQLMKTGRLITVVIWAGTMLSAPAFMFSVNGGKLYYHIDNENTVIDEEDPWTMYQVNIGNEVGGGSTNVFKTILAAHPNDSLRPWITTETAFKGERSLAFRWLGGVTEPDDSKDKVMYAIGPHYDALPGVNNWDPGSVLRADEVKYVGFALCIPGTETMELRNGMWTLIFQSFQMYMDSGRPPFAIHIQRDNQTEEKVDLLFLVRDDSSDPLQQTGDSENAKAAVLLPNIQRNKWYEFVIRLQPSRTDNGSVLVWAAEGDKLPSFSDPARNDYMVFSYYGRWGYDVSPDVPTFSQQIGLYSGERDVSASILVDEIKYGTTYNYVNP